MSTVDIGNSREEYHKQSGYAGRAKVEDAKNANSQGCNTRIQFKV